MTQQFFNGIRRPGDFTRATLLAKAIGVLLLVCCCSCSTILGKHVVHIESKRDILAAPSETDDILIPRLPLKDYPLLAKFRNLRRVAFYAPDGTGASDEKLRALAAVDLPNLKDIMLLNCPSVTDIGIRALSTMPLLIYLQLEGTSITDRALEFMASETRLLAVNVANCTNVTLKGLKSLAESETLKRLTFSSDKLTQQEVEALIDSFRTITSCGIVDTTQTLDEAPLKAKGAQRGINVSVRSTGALQQMKMTDDEIRKMEDRRRNVR